MESGEPLPRRDGRGGWRAALFIVAVGFLERIGFNGVGGNLITYLTGPLGMSTAAAAAGVNAWSGTVLVLPLVGALAADSRLGRYRAVLIAGVLYLLVSMLAQTSLPLFRLPSILEHPCRVLIPWPSLRGRRCAVCGGGDYDLLHRRISPRIGCGVCSTTKPFGIGIQPQQKVCFNCHQRIDALSPIVHTQTKNVWIDDLFEVPDSEG